MRHIDRAQSDKKVQNKLKSRYKGRKLMSKRRNVTVSQVVSCIRSSKYVTALRKLLSLSPTARRAFDVTVVKQVRQQVTAFLRDQSNTQMFSGTTSIEQFCWQDEVSRISHALPTLYAAMSASMPAKKLTYV